MPLVAAYISRYYATRMPSETNISLRCWWVRSSGVIEVLADRTTERHENMNSRNTSTSTTAVRARACDSILLYIHAHETCSQRSIGWSDLAALESCRFVSHGCGVPALPTIQPWRLKSYDAAQLQLRTVKLLRCADYHFNFLGVFVLWPSKHHGRQPSKQFYRELSQWSSSQICAPGRQQARHCFITAEGQYVQRPLSLYANHTDCLTCPSRQRNRPRLRLPLQRRQWRKHILQGRRSRPVPHAPRQPQPRPRSLPIEYHIHARVQPILHSPQDHAVDHHPAQRHGSTLVG